MVDRIFAFPKKKRAAKMGLSDRKDVFVEHVFQDASFMPPKLFTKFLVSPGAWVGLQTSMTIFETAKMHISRN